MQVAQYTYVYVCTAVCLKPAFDLVPPPSGRSRTMRISEIRTSQKNSCLDNQNEKLNNESALRSS